MHFTIFSQQRLAREGRCGSDVGRIGSRRSRFAGNLVGRWNHFCSFQMLFFATIFVLLLKLFEIRSYIIV